MSHDGDSTLLPHAFFGLGALYLNWRRTKHDAERLNRDAMRLENETYVNAIEQLGNLRTGTHCS